MSWKTSTLRCCGFFQNQKAVQEVDSYPPFLSNFASWLRDCIVTCICVCVCVTVCVWVHVGLCEILWGYMWECVCVCVCVCILVSVCCFLILATWAQTLGTNLGSDSGSCDETDLTFIPSSLLCCLTPGGDWKTQRRMFPVSISKRRPCDEVLEGETVQGLGYVVVIN